jgi:hypothetical protein
VGWLVGITAGIVSLHVAAYVFLFQFDKRYFFLSLFDLNREGNISTFFASGLLAGAALLFWIIGKQVRESGGSFAGYWALLSLLFIFGAADEFVSFHEHLNNPLRRLLGTSGLFYFAWVIPYVVIVVGVLLIYARFFFRLPLRFRWRFGVAAAVFLFGAVGMEMAGGRVAEVDGFKTPFYIFLSTLEETLEMVGILLLIRSQLLYLDEFFGNVSIRFDAGIGRGRDGENAVS